MTVDFDGSGRILYATSFDLSLVTGPAVNETEFCHALVDRFGDRVTLVLPSPANPEVELPPSVFTRGHQGYDPIHYLHNEWDQAALLDRLLATGQYDFLVSRLGILPFGAWWATRRHAIPFAIKTLSIGAFDAFHLQSGLKSVAGRVMAPVNEWLYRDLTRRAMAVDTCTDADLALFGRRFRFEPGQLRKVENATSVQRFQRGTADEARRRIGLDGFDPVIGFAGGRPSTRGAWQMVEIAAAVRKRYPRVKFVVLGHGDGVPGLEARAKELGVEDCVEFAGVVPYAEVATYLRAFDVGFSFDLKSNTDRIGNSSQKVLQYVAAGIPVVSGPGGNAFLETEGLGAIREYDDLDGILEATLKCLDQDDSAREEHASRAIRYAQDHLSIHRRLEERIAFWAERVSGRPRTRARLSSSP